MMKGWTLQDRDKAAPAHSADSRPIPEAEAETGEAVVVAHGLWMRGWEMVLLRRRLEDEGYHTYPFVYPTVGSGLDEGADRLATFVEQLPAARVHFVGHSLGGVLIVNAFERHEFERAGRIVCLGSPLSGTHAGRMLESTLLGRRIAGQCMHDLLQNGGCGRWEGQTELGIIAGDRQVGLGRLLGGLQSPHDGTISVEETKLEGATDHAVLRCTHISMLWSPEVAEYVLHFLRAGEFPRDTR